MRLDKFLKVSRLIKRRSIANEICEAQRVFVNDIPAKPAKQLKTGIL
jgi:ribosomal 50S subunit-recycling heat shock protein